MMNIKWFSNKNEFIETEIVNVKIKKNNSIELTIKFDFDRFEYIFKNNFFHLYKDVVVNQSRKSFDKDKCIEMDLRLTPYMVKLLRKRIEITKENLKNYLINSEDKELLNEKNWYVLNVKQEEELPPELKSLGSIKTGFSTAWNEEI